jgi:hypothetical protein
MSVTFRFAQRGPRLFLLAALVCVNPVKWSLSVVGGKSHSVNRVDNNHTKTLDFLSVVIFWLLGVSFFFDGGYDDLHPDSIAFHFDAHKLITYLLPQFT